MVLPFTAHPFHLFDLVLGSGFYVSTVRHDRGEENLMAFREGQVYRCPDPTCGCEVTVTKGAPLDCPGTQSPTCCCGRTMQLVS